MNTCDFTFAGTTLTALPSGALHWASERLLVVSDLHLGKSARAARWGGAQLPPYETRETLARLEADIAATRPDHVLCLGDSFDAAGLDGCLPEDDRDRLLRLQAGRRWTWIEGNHDPGPVSLGGAHKRELSLGPLVFRHITGASPVGEVSGHYHPKARLSLRGRVLSRPCFLFDTNRLMLPAYGAYTGGMACDAPELAKLFKPDARMILTGKSPCILPFRGSLPAADAGRVGAG